MDNASGVTIQSSGNVGAGIYLDNLTSNVGDANITNYGIIKGNAGGIAGGTLDDATIANYGTIDGKVAGIVLTTGGDLTVHNDGTAAAITGKVSGISGIVTGDTLITNAGKIASTGAAGIGIDIVGTGNIIVKNHGLVSAGDGTANILNLGGMSLVSTDGNVRVDNADGTVTTSNATGIFASALNGNVKILGGDDSSSVTATRGSGIFAIAGGDVTIDSGKVDAGGALVGSYGVGGGVLGLAGGNVDIISHGKVSTDGLYGVAGISTAGKSIVSIREDVGGLSSGDVPVIGGASVVLGGSKKAELDLKNGKTVNASGVGLLATNGGSGKVVIDAKKGSTVNSDALGIVGLGFEDGDVIVDAGQVNVSGTGSYDPGLGIPLTGGVLGASLGGGNVTVNANGKIVAANGTLFGAGAFSLGGSATVNVNAAIDPAIVGAFAITGGPMDATANINAQTDGTLIGVLAGNIGSGNVRVNVSHDGGVGSGGIGILAFKGGDGDVGVNLRGAVGGIGGGATGGDGVHVDYGVGVGDIDVRTHRGGSIDAGDDGIEINRLGGIGRISVKLGDDITAEEDGVKIYNTLSLGPTGVHVGDRWHQVTVDADHGNGIQIDNVLTSGKTWVSVDRGSKVIADEGSAISVVSTSLGLGGDHDVNVRNNGLLVGNGGLFTPTVGVLTDTDFDFTNQWRGRVTTDGHDPAASIFGVAAGGNIDIGNYGSMRGSMQLASLSSIGIDNNRRWTTSGFNEFAALCDVLVNNNAVIRTKGFTVFDFTTPRSTVNNSGLLRVSNDGGIPGVVLFTGLDDFNNAYGTVDMRSWNHLGTFTMPVYGTYVGNLVYMSGNFNGGYDSKLKIDAYLAGDGGFGGIENSYADLLVVDSVNNGYGGASTALHVNDLNYGPGEYNPEGIPVVGVLSGNTQLGDFFLAGGPIDKGLFTYDLFLDRAPPYTPPGSDYAAAWVLASYPDSSATALAQSLTIIDNMWDTTAGGWIDRSGDLRGIYGAGGGSDLALPGASHGGPNANGAWARAIGNWGSRSGSGTFEPFPGQPVSVANDYDESLWALQGGIDHAFDTARGTVVVGLLGGYESNSVNFASPGDSATYAGPMAGIYADWINGPAYFDALFKADFLKADLNIGGDSATTDGLALGGRIETGYRYRMKGNWFFEPMASLAYVNTHLDSTSLDNTDVDFDNGQSLRGELGFRSGSSFANGNLLYQPYVTASVGNEFLGDNSVFLASGPGVTVTDSVRGIYGKAGAGINVTNLKRNVTTYLQGTYMFADGYQSGSAKGGIRINW
jgi:outer membrane autotransporter protein